MSKFDFLLDVETKKKEETNADFDFLKEVVPEKKTKKEASESLYQPIFKELEQPKVQSQNITTQPSKVNQMPVIEATIQDRNTLKRFGKSFAGGGLGTVTGAASFLEAGPDMIKMAEDRLNKGVEPPGIGTVIVGEFGRGLGKIINKKLKPIEEKLSVENPTFPEKVTQGLGSAATFLIPGLGTAKGAQILGATPKVAALLGTTTSAVLESAVEGGSSYEEAKAKGMDEKSAKGAASKVFFANLPVNFILDKWMFNKIPVGKKITEILKGSSQEGAQEAIQQIIQNVAIDEPALRGAGESALIGAATGGLVGGGKAVIETAIEKKATKESVSDQPVSEERTTTIEEDLASVVPESKPVEIDPVKKEPVFVAKEETKKQDVRDSWITEEKDEVSGISGKPMTNQGVPDIKTTEDAIEFGKVATKEQVAQMETTESQVRQSAANLIKEGKIQEAVNEATKAQFLREARETYTETERKRSETVTDPDEFEKLELIKEVNRDYQKRKEQSPGPEQAMEKPRNMQDKRGRKEDVRTSRTPQKEDVQKLDAQDWQVNLPREKKIDRTINKTKIIRDVEKNFGVPIRSKITSRYGKLTAGTYHTKQELVRLKRWGELEPLTHEVAHHIEKLKNKGLGKTTGHAWLVSVMKQNPEIREELQNLDYDKSKKRAYEGFAEFMRHMLTTEEAKAKAPKFYKLFTEEILPSDKKLQKNLSLLSDQLRVWRDQGSVERVIQHIDFKGEHTKETGIKKKVQQAREWIIRNFYDEFYDIEQVTKKAEELRGEKLPPTKNPFKMATYMKSKSSIIARTFVMKKAIDQTGKPIGKGLVEILKPIPNNEMNNFIAYGISKRAVLLNKRGIEPGVDIEDAKYTIDKFQNKTWNTALDEITEWSNNLLKWVIDAGGISKEQAKIIRELNPVYLPFKRAFREELEVSTVSGGPGKLSNSGKAVKKIKGSGRPIINPIESMIQQATEMIGKAQKIHLAKLLVDLHETEGMGGFISKIPPPLGAKTITKDQFIKMMTDSNMLGEVSQEALDNVDDILTVFTQQDKYNGKENVVSIWRNGKKEFYEVHPDLYRAMSGIDVIHSGALLKLMAPFSRMLRLGATGIKVSFGLVRNPFRDTLQYNVTKKSKGYKPFTALTGAYKEIKSSEGDLIWRFKSTGGQLAGMIGFDRSATMSVYDEVLTEKLSRSGKVLKIVKNPIAATKAILDFTREAISFTEMAPRVEELTDRYKELQKEHPEWSEEDLFIESFLDAQDVTVNFTKSGYYGKRINEAVAFFNAALQGQNKIYRSFKENPARTTIRGFMTLTIPALIQWYWNKDEDWYKNLPYAYKFSNFFFKVKEGKTDVILRLPIPYDVGTIFIAAPLAGIDSMYHSDPKAVEGLFEIVKSQAPLSTTLGVPLLLPSALEPLAQVAANKNFLGVPIESKGDKFKHPTQRFNTSTTGLAKEVSKGMNSLGWQVSPKQIDYLLNSYTGGAIRQFKFGQTWDQPSDIPVLSDILLSTPDQPRRQLNEFFTDFETLSQKQSSDLATQKEKEKLQYMKLPYKTTIKRLKLISEYRNKGDVEKMNDTYREIKKELERIGY